MFVKVETTSSCFDNNLSFFMQHNIFLYITILFEKYGLHFFQNDLELQPTLSFSKNLQFGLFTQIWHQISLSLKLDNVTRSFWLICFVFETWSSHHLLAKDLIRIGSFSWEHVYLKCKEFFFKGCLGSPI